jgi:hypothetical protein
MGAAGFLLCGSALAADGSGNNNPDLLRGSYEAGCTNSFFCDGAVYTTPETPVARTAPSHPTKAHVVVAPAPAPCGAKDAPVHCAPPARTVYQPVPGLHAAPYDPYSDSFEADWSLTFGAAYNSGTSGQRFSMTALPEFSLTRTFGRGEISLFGDAELVKEGPDAFRFIEVGVGATSEVALGGDTRLTAGGNLDFLQESPYDPNNTSGNVSEPLVITGALDASVQRRFGRLGVELGGDVSRSVIGPTVLAGGTSQDNSHRNQIGFGGRARLLYELRGPLSAFVEGSADRAIYDRASPGAGAALNSWTYAIRGGVTGNWNDVLELEVSGGYAVQTYDSALLSDVPTAIADAQLTYRPGNGLELTGAVGTTISVPDALVAATADIAHTVSLGARYTVNEWLALRASVSGGWSRLSDGSQERRSYGAGVGADYLVNAWTTVAADYSYNGSDTMAGVHAHSHRVALGVTLSR